MSYSPTPVAATDLQDLVAYLGNELRQIAGAIETVDNLNLTTLHVEPVRPREGLVVLADGTNWDPGSGAGFYGYYGAAWVKLG